MTSWKTIQIQFVKMQSENDNYMPIITPSQKHAIRK